jgi:RNA-binding protein 5/10
MASKQYGFVEFYTMEDATLAMSKCVCLSIDGALVNVAYARRQHLESAAPVDGTLSAWQSYYAYGEDVQQSETQKEVEMLIQQGYVYDETCGYYYNATTNYHYDINTKYFYDNSTGVWMYYDVNTGEYLAVQQETVTEETQPPPPAEEPPVVEEIVVPEEVIVPKKPMGPELPEEMVKPTFASFSLKKVNLFLHVNK